MTECVILFEIRGRFNLLPGTFPESIFVIRYIHGHKNLSCTTTQERDKLQILRQILLLVSINAGTRRKENDSMGHLTTRDAYKNLEERINWFTQGAPPSETLYKILQVLYTEKEAKWVARLPVRPFTLKRAAKIWGTTEAKAEKLLDHLCEKALLVDSEYKGQRQFVMPPPMAGFIEFALMRTRGDIDQKYLSELYWQYMNVEEDFVKDLFFATETRLGRVFVQEPVLTNDKTNHILDYERATHIVEEAK